MTTIPDLVLYVGSGEWSALYADGELVQCGDHYLADEKIREYAGVTVHDSNAFLLGGDGVQRREGGNVVSPGPAQNLAEVDRYVAARAAALQDAAAAREQAARLIEAAEEMEAKFR